MASERSRSVLITGCSDGGIGSALALAFSSRGFRVYATARQIVNMAALQGHDNIILLPLDVQSSDQMKAAVQAVNKDTDGTPDYLISNAGQTRFMPLLDENIDAAKKLYDTNVWGPLQLIQAFSPLLIKSKGTIDLNTSGSGYPNVPWQGNVAASKRSLEMLGDNLRVEIAPFDVKEEWKMPATSRYLAVEESYLKRAKGDDGAPRMENHKYAEGVVGKLLANPGPKLWYGGASGPVKFAASWLPTSWLDVGLVRGTGIDIMMRAKK